MNEEQWFEDVPVAGRLPMPEIAQYLRSIGNEELAEELELAPSESQRTDYGLESLFGRAARPWMHTAHVFGFAPAAGAGEEALPLVHAGSIEPDPTLRNQRVTITLDTLRVADYPGGGTHRVLVDFAAQNQAEGAVEQLHFNNVYRVLEGERAGVIGFPIFIGLNVAAQGVAFKCYTVNVQNEDDEAFLAFLESDVFRAGLRLVSAAQPAIAPLSEMAYNLTRQVAKRNRNVPVQDFYMGLDFSRTPTGARLAEGAYAAVQVPEATQSAWNWKDWVLDRTSGQIVRANDRTQLVPFNYLVFGVARFEEQ